MNDSIFYILLAIAGVAVYILITYQAKKAPVMMPLTDKQKADFKKQYDNEGIFTYKENGFDVRLEGKTSSIEWNDIETIFAYKIDLMTYDELAMEVIVKNNFSFRITEETEGWHQFVKKITELLPSVKQDFEMDLMFPAFETNLMVVYDMHGRSLEDLVKQDNKQ